MKTITKRFEVTICGGSPFHANRHWGRSSGGERQSPTRAQYLHLLLVALFLFACTASAQPITQEVYLTWSPNTNDYDVTSYIIYGRPFKYVSGGTNPRPWTNDVDVVGVYAAPWPIDNSSAITQSVRMVQDASVWTFSGVEFNVTAMDSSLQEGPFTEPVRWIDIEPPGPVSNLRFVILELEGGSTVVSTVQPGSGPYVGGGK